MKKITHITRQKHGKTCCNLSGAEMQILDFQEGEGCEIYNRKKSCFREMALVRRENKGAFSEKMKMKN